MFFKVNFLIRFFNYKMTIDLPFLPTGITHFEFLYNDVRLLVGKVEEVVCITNIKPEFDIILSINYDPNNKSDVNALEVLIKKINSKKNKMRIGKWEGMLS